MKFSEYKKMVKDGDIIHSPTNPEDQDGACIDCGQLVDVSYPYVRQDDGTFKIERIIIKDCDH